MTEKSAICNIIERTERPGRGTWTGRMDFANGQETVANLEAKKDGKYEDNRIEIQSWKSSSRMAEK